MPAPRQIIWNGLYDVNMLKASIPGCESLEKTSDTAKASIKHGPISDDVTLSDIAAPPAKRPPTKTRAEHR